MESVWPSLVARKHEEQVPYIWPSLVARKHEEQVPYICTPPLEVHHSVHFVYTAFTIRHTMQQVPSPPPSTLLPLLPYFIDFIWSAQTLAILGRCLYTWYIAYGGELEWVAGGVRQQSEGVFMWCYGHSTVMWTNVRFLIWWCDIRDSSFCLRKGNLCHQVWDTLWGKQTVVLHVPRLSHLVQWVHN